MNPRINNEESIEVIKESRPVFCVTKTSKYLALALFVLLPFIGGYVGYMYAPEKVVEVEIVRDIKKTEKKLVEEFAFDTAAYSPLADGGYQPRWYEDDEYFYCEGGKGVSEAKFTLPVEIEFTAISDSPEDFMVRDADPAAGEVWIRNSDRMFGTLILKETTTGKTYDMNCESIEYATASNTSIKGSLEKARQYLLEPAQTSIPDFNLDEDRYPRDMLYPDGGGGEKISLDEVSTHNTKENCWVVYRNGVHDISSLFQLQEIFPTIENLAEKCGTDINLFIETMSVEAGSLNTARFAYAMREFWTGYWVVR